MALVNLPLDTGPEGAAITTSNTGAMLVNFGTPVAGTGTYLAAAKAYGAYGVRLSTDAGGSAAIRFAFGSQSNQISTRFATTCLKEAASASDTAPTFAAWRHASGVVASLRYLKAESRIELVVGSAGTILAGFVPTSLSKIYRYAVILNNSTGAWSIKVYDTDDTTVVYQASGTATFANTTVFTHFQFGGGLAIAATQDIDYLQLDDGSATEIPAPTGESSLTATITANQTVPVGSAVTATVTVDGTVTSYVWTVEYPVVSPPALAGASTATVSLTAPGVGSLVILKCVVTASGGEMATLTTEVRVPATDNAVRPLVSLSSGSGAWQIIGGASSLSTALGDGNTATMVESPDITSTEAIQRFRFVPMAARSDLALTFAGVILTGSGSTACKVRIGYGTTQIKEAALAATTTAQDITVTLTAGEIASITDWGNVWAEIVAVT